MSERNIVVSFSGGRTSALMAKLMKQSSEYKNDNLVFIFANTGREFEATLEFVHACDRNFNLGVKWVEADVHHEHGIATTHADTDFYAAKRDGEPFAEVIKKYGISNAAFPHCTRELKNIPIRSKARSLFGRDYITALGMRFDELRRVKRHDPAFIWPMVDLQITVGQVREYWNSSPFDLALADYQGNCDLCWKKSLRKKLTLIKENPAVGDWWENQEKTRGAVNVGKRKTLEASMTFGRNNQSIVELREMAALPFVPANDPYLREAQVSELLDAEQPCSCASDESQFENDDEPNDDACPICGWEHQGLETCPVNKDEWKTK